MIYTAMRKYKKKGAQPIQDLRTEMYAKQIPDETCANVLQRIKRHAQGLRSTCRTVNVIEPASAFRGSLNPEHIHWMIIIDTSIVTLNELE